MQKTIAFSKAITRNIENTFTYSYVKNTGHDVHSLTYDPVAFFTAQLETKPFKTFMKLERYGYKNTKLALDRYNIPYTKQQERSAKLFYEVTELMNRLKRDIVPTVYFENIPSLDDTDIIEQDDGLTTKDTVSLHRIINRLPIEKETDNIVYESKLPNTVLNQQDQMDAIKNSLKYQVSCLIGGAGTGKSYVTARIIEQLKANDKTVMVLAPTHKAKESLQEKLSGGTTVRTIHSFVHSNKSEDPDVILVDESGMLSTPLCYSLLKKARGKQLVFVGDKNQLAPIEYGRPFEKIQKRFHTFELTKNRRSESPDIVTLGKTVIGEPVNQNIELPNIIQVQTEQEAFELDADVVLTFRNDDVKRINEMKRIKNGIPSISPEFSIGDIIIAKTNNKRYFNGQMFKVVSYDLILDEKTGKTIKLNDRRDLEYNFDLAYALTIHKSQGSEWDVVAYKPSDLDTRRLAYVAITRAKKKLVIIGGLQSEYMPEKEWEQLN